MSSCSELLSDWTARARYEDLPDTVVANTRLRVLDVIGLVLAAQGTAFGRAVRATRRGWARAVGSNHAGPVHSATENAHPERNGRSRAAV